MNYVQIKRISWETHAGAVARCRVQMCFELFVSLLFKNVALLEMNHKTAVKKPNT